MCLIIAPGPNGEKPVLPREVFNYTYGRNNDGFGAMWTEDEKVNHFKTLGLTADEVYDQMQEFADRHPDIVFHMRYKTHGKVIPGLSHPFRILNKGRHGKDLFFMHNGILGGFGNNLSYGQSDTTVFKDKVLVPLLTRNPNALDDPEIFAAIEKLTNGSRLIFMDSEGKVYRTAEKSWNNRYGLTLSNEYMLPSKWEEQEWERKKNPSTVVTLGYPGQVDRPIYNTKRRISFYGTEGREYWCCVVDHKYVRTEGNLLFEDQGPDRLIEYSKHYIPKADEHRYLSMNAMLESPSFGSSYDDDDTPFEDDTITSSGDFIDPKEDTEPTKPATTTTVGDAVVSMDEKLRYSRLLHNCHGNQVVHRAQLLGDLIGMSREEMYGLCKEDPETATTIAEELVEIVLAMNDVLMFSADDGEEADYAFDPDELVDRGNVSNHRQSMKDISQARKANYEEQVKRKVEEEKIQELTPEQIKKAM